MWRFIKIIFLFIILLFIILIMRFDHRFNNNYKIINNGEVFATYIDGNVYIGDNKFIEKLENVKENDVIILDDTKKIDPDYKIISSYKITDNIIQNEIINILLEYNRIHPSLWNRSVRSMKIEWTIHNLLYYFDYQTIRTMDVDFNNNDETVYNKKLLKDTIKKIIKKIYNRLGNLED